MPEFDSPWKEALDEFLRQFLLFFFPDIERLIDWSVTPESLDNELAKLFPDAAIGKRFVDRLYKVRLLDGSDLWLLLHIEVQASRETGFPKRVFRYFYRLDDKFDLPLTCLVVFADDSPTWKPNKFKYSIAGTKLVFSYPIVKLADYRNRIEELESTENPFALIVLAHLQSQSTIEPQGRLDWKRRITSNLLERKLDEADRWKVLRLVDWMIDLPVQLNEVFWGEVNEWKARNIMPFITGMEQMAMKKGLLSGLKVALEIKYNSEGKRFFEELKTVSDTGRLESLLEAIRSGATIDELRKKL